MDLISIIMPYYKKRKFISKTINSILAQSYKNFELIIIYDDKNKEDLYYLKKKFSFDKRIKIIINQKNIGAGLSRNKGILASKGKFLAFIDSDDIWVKNKIQMQIEFMKTFNYSITHTSYYIINAFSEKIALRKSKDLKFKDLLNSCDIGLSTVAINKKILKKNNIFASYKTKEDYFFWLNLTKNNKNIIYYINKPLTYWRNAPNSLSSSISQKLTDAFRVYSHFEKNFIIITYRVFILIISFIKKKINDYRFL